MIYWELGFYGIWLYCQGKVFDEEQEYPPNLIPLHTRSISTALWEFVWQLNPSGRLPSPSEMNMTLLTSSECLFWTVASKPQSRVVFRVRRPRAEAFSRKVQAEWLWQKQYIFTDAWGENHQDLCNRRSRGKGEQWVKNLATMPEVFLVCKNCLPASPYLPLAAPPPTVFGWLPLAFSQKPSLSSPPGATLPSLHSYSFSWLILQYSWALCWHVTPFMKVFLTTFFPR